MRELVRAGRGQQHRGRVHVDVRLARKREVEAREVHRAHDLRKENALGLLVRHVEERKFVVQAVVHRVGVVKNLLPVGGEEAVFVARDVRRRLGKMVCEILRDADQIIIRDGLGRKAASVAEVVRVIVRAPEKRERGIDREKQIEHEERAAVRGAPSLARSDQIAHHQHKQYDRRDRREHIQKLRDRKRQRRARTA